MMLATNAVKHIMEEGNRKYILNQQTNTAVKFYLTTFPFQATLYVLAQIEIYSPLAFSH